MATLETRRRKDDSVPVDRLREEWRARASEHGLDPERLAKLLDRTERFPAETLALARTEADLGGITGLTREASTFDRRDVLQAWAERHRDGAPVEDIEKWAVRLASGDRMPMRIDADPVTGVVDYVSLPAAGMEVPAHTRVLPGGNGTLYTFSMHQTPDLPDEVFDAQAAELERELTVLKATGGRSSSSGVPSRTT